MNDSPSHSSLLIQLLHQAGSGQQAALDALLRHQADRLTVLARRMLAGFAKVRRWAETDDVVQNALVRLVGALRDVKPKSHGEFLALATLQIRRELIDLARHYFGPQGMGANHESQAGQILNGAGGEVQLHADRGPEPARLLQWRELHQHIQTLPEEERQVVDLLFYQGLSQAEAAAVSQLSLRTLQRRWHQALQKLRRVWKDEG